MELTIHWRRQAIQESSTYTVKDLEFCERGSQDISAYSKELGCINGGHGGFPGGNTRELRPASKWAITREERGSGNSVWEGSTVGVVRWRQGQTRGGRDRVVPDEVERPPQADNVACVDHGKGSGLQRVDTSRALCGHMTNSFWKNQGGKNPCRACI